MAKGYYYLISSLPELSLTDKDLQYDLVTYRDFIKNHLSEQDQSLLRTLYYLFDITNFTNLVKENGKDWRQEGYFSKEEFEAWEEPDKRNKYSMVRRTPGSITSRAPLKPPPMTKKVMSSRDTT